MALEMEHLSLELQESWLLFTNTARTIASGLPTTFSTAGKALIVGKHHTEAPDLDLNIS